MFTFKYIDDDLHDHVVRWDEERGFSAPLPVHHVVQCSADDQGLSYVYEHFLNIPSRRSCSGCDRVLWYGDHAKFIAANLR